MIRVFDGVGARFNLNRSSPGRLDRWSADQMVCWPAGPPVAKLQVAAWSSIFYVLDADQAGVNLLSLAPPPGNHWENLSTSSIRESGSEFMTATKMKR